MLPDIDKKKRCKNCGSIYSLGKKRCDECGKSEWVSPLLSDDEVNRHFPKIPQKGL